MTLNIYLNNRLNVSGGFVETLLKTSQDGIDNNYYLVPKWLEEASVLGFKRVRLSGGEATLEFEKLLLIIQKAKELKMWCSLKTNGWWANDEYYWKMLIDSGLDCLRVTYDSDWFYKDSPITKQISMKAIGDGRDKFNEFVIIVRESELDLAELEMLNCNMEKLPMSILTDNYKPIITHTGFDPDVGSVTTVQFEFKCNNFTINSLGLTFTSSLAVLYNENTGMFDDRYIGDLNKESFGELYKTYLEKIK